MMKVHLNTSPPDPRNNKPTAAATMILLHEMTKWRDINPVESEHEDEKFKAFFL